MLTRFALNNPVFVLSLLVAALIFGPIGLLDHPSREDPKIVIRSAQVVATYPGLSAERVENLIGTVLEEKIREIPEIKTIETDNSTGQALIKIEVDPEYDDVGPIWADLRNKLDDVAAGLPEGTRGPFVFDDQGNVAMATVAITGDGFSNAEVREVAKTFRQMVYARVPGVRKVEFYGDEDQRIFVEFDNVRLARLGLDAGSIVSSISQQNVILPGGQLEVDGRSFTIEPTGDFGELEELRELAIVVPGSTTPVYLEDIARVEAAYQDPPSTPAYFNGRQAIVVGISMVDQFNVSAFSESLQELITTYESSLPVGYELNIITWQPDDIKKAVFGVFNNLWQTILIVLAVVIAFLGFRTGLLVGAMVPAVMLLTTLAMRQLGIELERMSLASLIIALGLLVDNGIVVAEDIQGRLQQGEARREAALAAGKALSGPLLAASLTTIFAFMPLMLAEGGAGEYTRSISLVIGIALLVSWVVAMTVLALGCAFLLKRGTANASGQDDDAIYDRGYFNLYRGLVRALIRARYVTLIVAFSTLGLGIWLFGFVSNTFFPASERAQLQIAIELPKGANTYATRAVTEQLEGWLLDENQNPEIENVVTYVANGGPRFYLALDPPDGEPSIAYQLVTLDEPAHVLDVQRRVRRWAAANVPEAQIYPKAMSMGPNEAGLMEYRISGPDSRVLKQASERLQRAFREIPGTANVKDDWRNPTIALQTVIDQEAARRAGVSSQDVANALSGQLSGTQATEYRLGDISIPVVLRAEEEQRTSLGRLASLNISNVGESPVPLEQVSHLRGDTRFATIKHRNLERTITVSGTSLRLTANALDDAMSGAVASVMADLPATYRLEKGGEVEGSIEAQEALGANLPLAFALMLLVLIWQFNSVRKPIMIFLTIPLVISGVAASLIIMPNASFSFMGILGFLALSGIVINNAIVLIDQVAIEEERGRSFREALVEAGVRRLRPIVMTTCTTAMGLLPVILAKDVLFYDLAVVIAGGLLVGTLLTLVVIPCLYSVVGRGRPRGRTRAPEAS